MEVRAALCVYYVDVDMKNAHPMIVTAAPSATSQRSAESRAGSGGCRQGRRVSAGDATT